MKAVWLENNSLSLRDDLPIPEPPPGEALVQVRLAGICSTDLELVRGYYPFTGVLGHEFVGEVIDPGGQPDLAGRRVVGEINATCGSCIHCLAGRPTHCINRTVLGIVDRHGAFAEYLALPSDNLYPVPDTVADESAVFVEPLAAALEIQEQVAIRPTDRVLVLGAGRLGQLVAQTLALTGCDLGVAARHPGQRRILKQRGLTLVAAPELQPGSWDVVIEATGSPDGFAVARQAVRPRGKIVLKSTYKGDLTMDVSALVVDEIQLVGSRCGPFTPALRLLAQGLVDPRPLIEARHSLEEALVAFDRAAQPGALKVLLQPSHS